MGSQVGVPELAAERGNLHDGRVEHLIRHLSGGEQRVERALFRYDHGAKCNRLGPHRVEHATSRARLVRAQH